MCQQQESRFLFVNKDARSPSLSNSFNGDAAAISRHVQPTKHRRRQAVQPAISPTTRRIAQEGWMKKDDADLAARSSPDSDSPRQVYVMNHIQGSTVDPFNQINPPLNEMTVSILRYFLKYGLMATFRNELLLAFTKTAGEHRHTDASQDNVKACLENTMHMNSLVARTGSRMVLTIPGVEAVSQQAHQSTQMALQDLQSHFGQLQPNKAVDIYVLLDVLHLCTGAWYRGEHEEAVVHLKALHQMMPKADTRDERYSYLLESTLAHDIFVAVDTGESPIFPLYWEPPDKSKEEMAAISEQIKRILHSPRKRPLWNLDIHLTPEEVLASKNGRPPFLYQKPTREEARYLGLEIRGAEQHPARGFIEALDSQVVSKSFAEIIETYIHITDVAVQIFLSDELMASDTKWLNQKGTALLHRLVSFKPNTSSRRQRQLDALDESFRVALMITLSYSYTPMQSRTAALNVGRLFEVVKTAMECPLFHGPKITTGERGSITGRFVLWVLVTGMLAAQQERPEIEAWFASRAATLAKKMHLNSYLQLHRVMGQFAHQDTLHHACLSRLAASIASDGN